MRIALAGNPNSGKTTMFNALTGRNEKVGNWAGVTVEKKEHPIKKSYCPEGQKLIAVDLPGAYSMSPFTAEESVTRDFIRNDQPDVIINIVDATNLSRSLFFTTQLMELGIPVVVALNKTDVNGKKENTINAALLSEKLGCPVIETISTSGSGLKEVMEAALRQAGKGQKAPYLQGDIDLSSKSAVEEADRKRFIFVNTLVAQAEKRKTLTKDKNTQDQIDTVITHPLLGLLIFACVMFLVFHISQSDGALGLGVWLADTLVGWLESFRDVVAGWVQGASPVLQTLLIGGVLEGLIAVIGFLPLVMVMYFLIALLEDCGYMARATVVLDPIFKKVGLSGKSVIPFVIGTGCAIPGIMACRTIRSDRERMATAMLTPFMPCGAKLPVIALFAGVFFSGASWVGTLMYFMGIVLILLGALLVNKISGGKRRTSFFIMELPEYKAPSFVRAFQSMCNRGWAYIVKAGTIILLCNFIIMLLQSYTPAFRYIDYEGIEAKYADQQNAIIETLMADIDSEVYEAFVASQDLAGGTLPALEDLAPFIPDETYAAALAENEALNAALHDEMTAAADRSILKAIASPFAFLLIPLGFGVWQLAAAAITGFIAKENVVGTIAISFGITNLISTGDLALVGSATSAANAIGLSGAAALSCMMFNLFTPPCFAAIGAMNAEIKSKKWFWGGIGLQLYTGYTLSFLTYQLGTLITTGAFGTGFLPGLIAVLLATGFIVHLAFRTDKKQATENKLTTKA